MSVIWLICVFLVLDLSKGLLVSWAKQESEMHVILVKEFCVLFSAMFFADLNEAWKYRRWAASFAPITGLSLLCQSCAFRALRVLDAGSFKLMLQACLPLTALLSWVVLGRRYSGRVQTALVGVFMSSVLFTLSSVVGEASVTNEGVLYAIGFVLLSCVCSVFSEKTLAAIDCGALGLAEQMVHSKVVGIAILSTYEICKSFDESSKPLLDDFTWKSWLVIAIYTISAWVVTSVIKRFSATTKNVVQASSAAITYLISICVGVSTNATTSLAVVFAALLLLSSVGVYVLIVSNEDSEKKSQEYMNVDVKIITS